MIGNFLLSHTAILVPSVSRAADHLRKYPFQIGPEETFEAEGTREIYVEQSRGNSLLLMESIGPGPYRRALEKRGPGLHHIALDVLNLEDFMSSINGTGWLLHPSSIQTIKKTKTAYLARPGFSALIEVQEKPELVVKEPFITKIEIPYNTTLTKLLKSIGLAKLIEHSTKPTLFIGEQILSLSDLF